MLQKTTTAKMMMVLSVFLYAAMDVVVKLISQNYPLTQIIFFKSCTAFIAISFYAFFISKTTTIKTKKIRQHLLRFIFGNLCIWCLFYSLTLFPVFDVYSIVFLGPLMSLLFAKLYLKEQVSRSHLALMLLSLLGALLILRPDKQLFSLLTFIPILGTFFFTMMRISTRTLATFDNPITLTFYFYFFSTVYSLAMLFFYWTPISFNDFCLLILVGLLGVFAQVSMNFAFKLSPLSNIILIEYTGLIWAILFGYLFWNDIPDLISLLGTFIICISSFYIQSKNLEPLPALEKSKPA